MNTAYGQLSGQWGQPNSQWGATTAIRLGDRLRRQLAAEKKICPPGNYFIPGQGCISAERVTPMTQAEINAGVMAQVQPGTGIQAGPPPAGSPPAVAIVTQPSPTRRVPWLLIVALALGGLFLARKPLMRLFKRGG